MLLPHHQKLLEESGISPEVVAARGYRSAKKADELKELGFASYQCRVPALLIPMYDVTGRIVSHQIRPDNPRQTGPTQKPVKYETPKGSRVLVDIPPAALPAIGDPSRPLVITEGVRKADAAVSRGLCCVPLMGVWGWRGKNQHGGSAALPDWESIALKRRAVYLAFDSDVVEKLSVSKALERLRAFLVSRGATVKILRLPPGPAGEKVGLDDYLSAGHSTDELFSTAVDDLEPGQPGDTSIAERGRLGRPRVVLIEKDLHFLTLATWEAINKANDPNQAPRIFTHGAAVVRVDTSNPMGVRTEVLTTDTMRCELVRMVEFLKSDPKKPRQMQPARPPADLVANLLASSDPPLPRLVRLTRVPVLESGGRLVTRVGYDPVSKIYLADDWSGSLSIPERITSQDVIDARELLEKELLGDFPFVARSDLANALGLMILPFVRDMISGPTPLHLIEKPSPGTGASLLTEMLVFPALGSAPAMTSQATDDEEWRKRITALLAQAPMFCVIDNVREKIDSAALSAVITSRSWEDRVLGHSRTISLPVTCVWIATGNNPTVSEEISRRTVPIRLDSGEAKPWERPEGGFRHPDLRGWAKANRSRIVRAILILARGWIEAGCPEPSVKPILGSFEDYIRVIGGILSYARVEGFLGNLGRFRDRADSESEAHERLMQAWWDAFKEKPIGVSEILNLFPEDEGSLSLGSGSAKSRQTKLGILLRALRDRRFVLQEDEGRFQVRLSCVGHVQRAAQYQLIRESERRQEHRDHEGRRSHSRSKGSDVVAGEPGEPGEPLPNQTADLRGAVRDSFEWDRVCESEPREREQPHPRAQDFDERFPTGDLSQGKACSSPPPPNSLQWKKNLDRLEGCSPSPGSHRSPAGERLIPTDGRDDDCEVIE